LDKESKKKIVREALPTAGFFEPDPARDGYHHVGVDNERLVAYSDIERQRLRKERYERCGIPRAMFDLTINNFTAGMDVEGNQLGSDDRSRKDFAKNVVGLFSKHIVPICAGYPLTITTKRGSHEVSSLILEGDTRSGKTMLAAIIAKEAANNGQYVRFLTFKELKDLLISYYDLKDLQQELNDQFRRCDLIVIDGVDEKTSDTWAKPVKEGLERLSEFRANSGRPTVITCAAGLRFDDGHPLETLAARCQRLRLPGVKS
jgi:hypothetical protein